MGDFDVYLHKTQSKIKSLEAKLEKTNLDNKKELKRIKNMISAYESRIGKRTTIENLKN